MEVPQTFEFPFEPYKIQYEFMKTLYEVLDHRKLGIFESPTGTGKSLSIICGAIRWLKDHNHFEREQLKSGINKLEEEKGNISAGADWLEAQAKENELNRRINNLKLWDNKIEQYQKKIEKIFNKKAELKKKKFKKKIESHPKDTAVDDDDDLVLNADCDESDEEPEDLEDVDSYKPTKIYICSRTHSQLSQFVGEILKSPFGKTIRVATLASRQCYCINPSVNKLKHNSLINERCLDIKKTNNKATTDADGKIVKKRKGENSRCSYYKQTAIEDLKDLALTEVQDVEDLVKSGQELKACPYYASRLAAEDAEVILVPYNTILHRATREANGIDLANNIVIIDEAHNLLEAMAQMHNSEVYHSQIEQGLVQVKCYKQRFNTKFAAANLLMINQLIFVLTKLQEVLANCNESKTDTFTVENFVTTAQIDNFNMFKLVKFCKDSHIAQKVRTYTMKYPFDQTILKKPVKKGVKDFLSSIAKKSTELALPTPEDKKPTFTSNSPLLPVISFLESLTYSYSDGRIFIHKNPDKFQFLLLNPSQNFEEIVKQARAVVVAGGTMKPIDEFKNRLFLNSGASPGRIVHFSCNHIIPKENILPIIVTHGEKQEKLLFNYENRMLMGNSMKRIIQESCKRVIGGIVIFFPSYKYEEWIWEQIKDLSFGRPVFREPQDSGSVDSVLKAYSDAIRKSPKNGALLLSVVGGKLSEGLNFSDDLGRCVIVVGLPYPNIMAPDLKEKMNYLDKTEGVGSGNVFYEGLCMKAVNQSIGRAVRHINDYATILLLDERYDRLNTKNALPDFIRSSLKVGNFHETFEHVSKFFLARRGC